MTRKYFFTVLMLLPSIIHVILLSAASMESGTDGSSPVGITLENAALDTAATACTFDGNGLSKTALPVPVQVDLRLSPATADNSPKSLPVSRPVPVGTGNIEIQPPRIDAVAAAARDLAVDGIKHDTFSVMVPGSSTPRQIVTAGSDHFKTLWTRDACFSMFGLSGDAAGRLIMKDTLQSFFDRAAPTGQLPRRLGDQGNPTLVAYSFFGYKTPDPKKLTDAEYMNELNIPQIDCTALPLIQANEYYKASGDLEFLKKNYSTLCKAVAWLRQTAGTSLLIDQPGSADWKDVLRRSGKVAYTNMLFYKSFDAMSELSSAMGEESTAAEYKSYAGRIKAAINNEIWDDKLGYYRDSNEAPTAFSSDGNMLAVIWGVAEGEKTGRIMDRLEYYLDLDPLPFPALEGDYPDANVPSWIKLTGMRHYHDRFIWPWQGNVFAVAAARTGRLAAAVKALNKVGGQAVKDGSFYEIYEMFDGALRPVRTPFYKSEPDFLWSEGTYLWAYREVASALNSVTGK